MKYPATALLLLFSFLIACEKEKPVEVNKESYPIPGDNFFPEGIAYDPHDGVFYTGSTTNGDIVKVDVKTGAVELFGNSPKLNRASALGMKLDHKERLWVCGGEDNKIHVLDKKGETIKTWDLKALYNSGFLNDCALDKQYVYFTDSRVQKIYRADVSKAEPGDVEEWFVFTNQQIPYVAGFNANGIVLTPDGKYIIIIISGSGKLYRVDRATKDAIEITLNTPVNGGDGLWLDGNILYVSRNSLNKIFPVTLNNTYTSGTVGMEFGDNLMFNTTIAQAGKYLLVVNGQLNRRPGPSNPPPPILPFTISRVAIPGK